MFSTQNCSGGVQNHLSSRNTLASNDIRIGLIWMLNEPSVLGVRPVAARY
jgi:hypothetical protein